MPFEYWTQFSPVVEKWSDHHLNTRRWNTGQVLVFQSDVTVIRIPTVLLILGYVLSQTRKFTSSILQVLGIIHEYSEDLNTN